MIETTTKSTFSFGYQSTRHVSTGHLYKYKSEQNIKW